MENSLLLRQIKKAGATPETPPASERWPELLDRIARTYKEAEDDRYLMERSLEKVSVEMQQLYESLRKASEHALALERDKLKAIITATGDGLATMDREGRIQSMNPAGVRLLGWVEKELEGQLLVEMLVGRELPPDRELHLAIVEGKAHRNEDTRFVHREGSILDVSYALSPIHQASEITGFVLVFHDITLQKQAEAELKRARAEAEATSRLKSEFLANMSHEIRTPLTAVLGMTGLLLGTRLDAEQREYASTVRSSGQHLLDILGNILDLSKIEAGRLELECTDLSVRSVVDEVLQIFSENGGGPKVELVGHVGPSVPESLVGDPGRLRQILINLVSNALKFTKQGEVVITVRLLMVASGQAQLHFEVRDTGIGMDEQVISRLFTPFTQADGSTTRRFGGTGLGLAISRQLVELMGGKIGVKSKPSQGSTFWFTTRMPVQLPNLDRPPLPLLGSKFLVVDDNAANRSSLLDTLSSWGAQVSLAESGVQALVALAQARGQKPYDAILLDHHMPGLPGLDLARALHVDRSFDGLRIFWMGRLGQGITNDTLHSAGITRILAKPVRQEALKRTLIGGEQPEETPVSTPETPRSKEGLVLVAEDNPVNQRLLSKLLENIGYSCEVVENGVEAVRAVERHPYNLVLMDCMMPEMDGYQATKELRQRGYQLPILAMTANALPGARETCLQSGMDDYLTKPIDSSRLEAALRKWIRPISQVLNLSAIEQVREITGRGDQELKEMLDVFLEDARQKLKSLEGATNTSELSAMGRIAHTLKSSSGYLGAAEIQSLCTELEKAAYASDFERARPIAQKLPSALARYQQELRTRGLHNG